MTASTATVAGAIMQLADGVHRIADSADQAVDIMGGVLIGAIVLIFFFGFIKFLRSL